MDHTNCPESHVWQDFLEGRLTPSERTSLEQHLVTCLRCRVGLISQFDTREEAKGVSSLTKQRSPRYKWMALAASVVIAVGMTLLVWNYGLRSRTVPTVEPTRSSSTNYAFMLISPADGAQLPRTTVEFAWQAFANNARYSFTLTNEKGDIVIRESSANNKIVVDLARLEPPSLQTYYWTVTAQLPDGTSVESGVAGFKIKQ